MIAAAAASTTIPKPALECTLRSDIDCYLFSFWFPALLRDVFTPVRGVGVDVKLFGLDRPAHELVLGELLDASRKLRRCVTLAFFQVARVRCVKETERIGERER